MGCLPVSGGCEHKKLLLFVEYLNSVEATDYAITSCLDIERRNSPQPEAMYENSLGERLVIERKSFVWPVNYAERHSADHFFVDAITQRLSQLLDERPCVLEVASGISLSHKQLSDFAEEISDAVVGHMTQPRNDDEVQLVVANQVIRFRFQPAWERDEWEPAGGLCIEFRQWPPEEPLDPNRLPGPMLRQVDRMLASVMRKFLNYQTERRILLIEGHGDARWYTNEWWSKVFTRHFTCDEPMEVWRRLEDAGEGGKGEMFWKVFQNWTL